MKLVLHLATLIRKTVTQITGYGASEYGASEYGE